MLPYLQLSSTGTTSTSNVPIFSVALEMLILIDTICTASSIRFRSFPCLHCMHLCLKQVTSYSSCMYLTEQALIWFAVINIFESTLEMHALYERGAV